MVFFEKSYPEPSCLEAERQKTNGDYACDGVYSRLVNDFKEKCYLCERLKPDDIEIEHFIPHLSGKHKDRKFSWENLFLACSNCNSIKGDREGLLNCTDPEDNVDTRISFRLPSFPKEDIKIDAIDQDPCVHNTVELLRDIHVTFRTERQQFLSGWFRDKITEELDDFVDLLVSVDEGLSNDKSESFDLIGWHLSNASAFTAFKRWFIKDDPRLLAAYGHFFIPTH